MYLLLPMKVAQGVADGSCAGLPALAQAGRASRARCSPLGRAGPRRHGRRRRRRGDHRRRGSAGGLAGRRAAAASDSPREAGDLPGRAVLGRPGPAGRAARDGGAHRRPTSPTWTGGSSGWTGPRPTARGPALPRADPRAPAAARARPGRAGRPRDRAVQARRAQAEEPRPHRLLPGRLRGLAARAGLPGQTTRRADHPNGWSSPYPRCDRGFAYRTIRCQVPRPSRYSRRCWSPPDAACAGDDGRPQIEDYASTSRRPPASASLGRHRCARPGGCPSYGGGGGANRPRLGGERVGAQGRPRHRLDLDATRRRTAEAKAFLEAAFATDEDGNTHAPPAGWGSCT